MTEFAMCQSVLRGLPALFCLILITIEKYFYCTHETQLVRPVFLIHAAVIPNPEPLLQSPPPGVPLCPSPALSVLWCPLWDPDGGTWLSPDEEAKAERNKVTCK